MTSHTSNGVSVNVRVGWTFIIVYLLVLSLNMNSPTFRRIILYYDATKHKLAIHRSLYIVVYSRPVSALL